MAFNYKSISLKLVVQLISLAFFSIQMGVAIHKYMAAPKTTSVGNEARPIINSTLNLVLNLIIRTPKSLRNCVFWLGQICPSSIKLDFHQSQETVFIAQRTRGKDNRSKNSNLELKVVERAVKSIFIFMIKNLGQIPPPPPSNTIKVKDISFIVRLDKASCK